MDESRQQRRSDGADPDQQGPRKLALRPTAMRRFARSWAPTPLLVVLVLLTVRVSWWPKQRRKWEHRTSSSRVRPCTKPISAVYAIPRGHAVECTPRRPYAGSKRHRRVLSCAGSSSHFAVLAIRHLSIGQWQRRRNENMCVGFCPQLVLPSLWPDAEGATDRPACTL